MRLRKRILVGSVSTIAVICAGAPAFAADASDTTKEIVVTGIKQSLQKAIQVKELNDDQVEAISAIDIGKLPDKNVADALTRLPGLNTQSTASGEGGFDEVDRVSIRGTSPSLTEVTIDGHNVATGDWFILDQYQTVGRSVSFTLLPSEIVGGVTVYKTQDASMLEGGVAGSVDVATRNPLDAKKAYTIEAEVQGAYNSLTNNTKPQINALLGWKSADDTFGAILQGFYEDRTSRRYGQETLGYTTIAAGMPIATANPSLIGVQAPTLIGSSLFEQERIRQGVDGSLQWRPTDKFEVKLSGFYSKLNASNDNYNYMYWGIHELQNNLPTSYTVKNNTLTSAVWPASYHGTPVDGLVVDGITRPNENSDTYYVNLDGKYKPTDNLTFKGQVGFTQGDGHTPQQPSFEVDGGTGGISYAPSGNGWAISPVGINPQSPTGLANDWAWNAVLNEVDKEAYGKIDGDWELGDGVFKHVLFGARVSDHTRQVDAWDRGCTLGANGDCYGAGPLPFSTVDPTSYPGGYTSGALGIPGLLVPISGNPAAIGSVINGIANADRGNVAHTVQAINYWWPASFKVHELDTEGYLQTRFSADKLRGNIGVRIVSTEQTSYVNTPDNTGLLPGDIKSSAYGDYYVDQVKHNYLDVLPSLNLTYTIEPKLLARFSAAETMSRPDFSALGGAVNLTDLTQTGNAGNPNLRPIKGEVYDAALEWYYASTALLAVSVFHDDLSNYVGYGNVTGTYVDQLLTPPPTLANPNPAPVYANYTISEPVNTTGELTGVELQWQQPIAYGFGVQTNFTYVDSKSGQGGPLVGTSQVTYNVVGYYENKWLSGRLAYNYRSHFLVGLDRSSAENQDNLGTLDGSLDVNITPNVALTVDAKNLTDSLFKYYAANRTQPRAVYENGTQLYFGLRAKF